MSQGGWHGDNGRNSRLTRPSDRGPAEGMTKSGNKDALRFLYSRGLTTPR